MAGDAPTRPTRRGALPDYETTLRENARRVLLDSGVPPDQVDAEWERLRDTPFPLPPSDEELDAMAGRRRAAQDPQAWLTERSLASDAERYRRIYLAQLSDLIRFLTA